jgi:hypothetical protein
MPEHTAAVRVVNRRDQPLELHCGGVVHVVPPRGSLVLAAALLETPQVEVLMRRRALATHPVSAGDDGPTEADTRVEPAGATAARGNRNTVAANGTGDGSPSPAT